MKDRVPNKQKGNSYLQETVSMHEDENMRKENIIILCREANKEIAFIKYKQHSMKETRRQKYKHINK